MNGDDLELQTCSGGVVGLRAHGWCVRKEGASGDAATAAPGAGADNTDNSTAACAAASSGADAGPAAH
jgi:hypothetical protein